MKHHSIFSAMVQVKIVFFEILIISACSIPRHNMKILYILLSLRLLMFFLIFDMLTYFTKKQRSVSQNIAANAEPITTLKNYNLSCYVVIDNNSKIKDMPGKNFFNYYRN